MMKVRSCGFEVSFLNGKSSFQVSRMARVMGAMATCQVAIQCSPEDLAREQGGVKYTVSFLLLIGLLTWQV